MKIAQGKKVGNAWIDQAGDPSTFTAIIGRTFKSNEMDFLIKQASLTDAAATNTRGVNAVGVLLHMGAGSKIPVEWFTLDNLIHQDKIGNSALHTAAEKDLRYIPKEFLTVPNLIHVNNMGCSPLQRALHDPKVITRAIHHTWRAIPFLSHMGWILLSSDDRERVLQECNRSMSVQEICIPELPKELNFIKEDLKHIDKNGTWEEL